jgi:hypothetical protein
MSVPLLGHALHVRATGTAVLLCSTPVRVGPNPIWPGSLGHQSTWERPVLRKQPVLFHSWRRRSGGGGVGRKGQEEANGFSPPPWLLIVQT